jgi:hypothetical protein
MSSPDLARDSIGRLPCSKGLANLEAKLFPNDRGLLLKQHGPIIKSDREMHHDLPALEENNPSPSYRQREASFQKISQTPVIRHSCRALFWNRQASISMDLITLAVSHGWRCLPMSDPCACDAFRSSVAREA